MDEIRETETISAPVPPTPSSAGAALTALAASAGRSSSGSRERRRADAFDPEPQERDEAAESVGCEVLDECRAELMMAFRFMDTALWHMPFSPEPGLASIGTDGERVAFDPAVVMRQFAQAPNETVRDLLHLVLHCVFRHPFDTVRREPTAWEVACDAVVEGVALEMAGERWPCPRDDMRRAAVEDIVKLSGSLNPRRIYRALEACLDGGDVDVDDAARRVYGWGLALHRDNHALWAPPEPDGTVGDSDGRPEAPADPMGEDAADGPDGEDAEDAPADGDASGSDGGGDDAPDDGEPDLADLVEAEMREDGASDDAGEDDERRSEADEAWREIARELEAGLASYEQQAGSQAGSLSANLELATRKPVDYAEFLRQFATRAEEIKVNDDEFDYVFYTYGLALYGNMPLVEPLEYQESERVREFVIAIDTSASCSGELVRTFVTRTCEILRESKEFSREVTIHVIQCDARIQRDDVITSVDDLERYRDGFQAVGGGGTDFRPVFDYVDELIDRGELEDLRGLIYFTDGMGTYPSAMPAYDAAFVFVDDDPRQRTVPPWAMKVVIDSEAVRQL